GKPCRPCSRVVTVFRGAGGRGAGINSPPHATLASSRVRRITYVVRTTGQPLARPAQGGRPRRGPETLGGLLPPPRRPGRHQAARGAAPGGRRGGRSPECLRQLLPRCQTGLLPPARQPRRPLAPAVHHHRPQGPAPAP